MELVLASRNKKKIAEMQKLLSDLCKAEIKLLSLDDIGYTDEIIEDGESFEENAVIKASVPASMGYIGIADDSGLAVDCLFGKPGIYSARYAGDNATDEDNNRKLLAELSDVKNKNRRASYVSVVALAAPHELFSGKCDYKLSVFTSNKHDKDISVITFRGECYGEIIEEYRGNGGFGYDPLFYIDSLGKTFAELTPDEKNSISHRGYSMKAFADWLNKGNLK